MTGKVTVQSTQEVGAALAESEGILRVWEVDIETGDQAELRELCAAAAVALHHGRPAILADRLRRGATRKDIAAAVDTLMDAFPVIREKVDLRGWSRMLAEELVTDAPSEAALQAGVRALVREAKMPPSISEILAAVAAQKARCQSQANLLERLPRRVSEIAHHFGLA